MSKLPPVILAGPMYEPKAKRISLPAACSRYAAAHEFAHAEQHRTSGWLWRLHIKTHGWPYVTRAVRALLEADAALIALRAMPERSEADFREAGAGVASYLLAMTGIPAIAAFVFKLALLIKPK